MATRSAVAFAADKVLATNIVTGKGAMRKTVTSEAMWAAALKVSPASEAMRAPALKVPPATAATTAGKSRCADSYAQRAQGNACTEAHHCPYSHDVPRNKINLPSPPRSDTEAKRDPAGGCMSGRRQVLVVDTAAPLPFMWTIHAS